MEESNVSNPVLRRIVHHYRIPASNRSDEQLQREAKIFGLRFNRWLLFPAAVIFQFCCGSLYAWSVYNAPIDILIYGQDRQISPITFYIAVGCFGFSAAVMGPWLERNGPRKAGLLGSSLFFLGNLLTSLALYTKQMWLVFVGYGMIGGFGLGLCYISPVSALQKWFPDRRGLGSGFAICGFGAGSIAIALIPLPLSRAVGLPSTFLILGCIFFVIMTLSSLVLRAPPPGYSVTKVNEKDLTEVEKSDSHKLTLVESLLSTEFRIMYIMFFANSLFGLVVISRLSNMVRLIFGRSALEASTIVSANGGFNLFGRLFFSILSDKLGRKCCFFIMMTFQLVILGCFSTLTNTQSYWAFVICMWLLTACYGGGFGVIPAFLSDMFGDQNIGACHGVILTAWSIAGVGGGLLFTGIFNDLIASGYKPTDPFPYNVNVWWIFGIVSFGWIVFQFLRVNYQDRFHPRCSGELLRIRLGSRLLRLESQPKFRLHYLSLEEEARERAPSTA